MRNYAFIDGQNLYSGILSLGWSIDLRKFRVHLQQKYHVTTAFYFLGYMPSQAKLYQRLQGFGYELQFKPVVQGPGHDTQGNVDADLVLKSMVELPNFDQAVLVTGDGDYYSLVAHLSNLNKLNAVLAPNRKYCSS